MAQYLFSHLECQYNRDTHYNEVKDEDEDEDGLDNDEGAQAAAPDSEVSGSSRRSSLGNDGSFVQKVHQQTAKQKLRQLQELVAMVQVRQITEKYLQFYSGTVDVLDCQNEKKCCSSPSCRISGFV